MEPSVRPIDANMQSVLQNRCFFHRSRMYKSDFSLPGAVFGAIFVALACVSCADLLHSTPMPDHAALGTRPATGLTAKAPVATWRPNSTRVPSTRAAGPSPMPSATPTPTAAASASRFLLAYVRVGQNESANIVLYDQAREREEMLTHFTEPLSMVDLIWAVDAQWLAFVSAHDFIHSRRNERNVFLMRPDGTDLRMVTGEYLNPEEAPGPYAPLRGRVVGGKGSCLVCAQGASPVTADEKGEFELLGVPVSAKWARAVCQDEELVLQGDVDLAAAGGGLAPVSIVVQPSGQGWRQVSLSGDGRTFGGTFYSWEAHQDGKREYLYRGLLCDLQGRHLRELPLPPGTTLMGLDWSPTSDAIAGALTGEKAAWLWLWEASGTSRGALLEIPNPESEILSAAHPAWSPDASQVVFELRHWFWWGERQHKTNLAVVSATGADLRTLVETEWGVHARHPSWTPDGSRVFYELSVEAPGEGPEHGAGGEIWSVAVAEPTPALWRGDGASYLPAAGLYQFDP